jgi:hypothetical protein
MSGLQWIIHICKTLESFYLNEIHNILWFKFNEVYKQYNSSKSVLPADNMKCERKWEGLSISSVTHNHEIFLNSITKCVSFLQSNILKIIKESIVALGLFDEAHEAADANYQLLFPSTFTKSSSNKLLTNDLENHSLDEMSMKIILSRLNHTANRMSKFQVLKNELLDTIEELFHQQDTSKENQVYVAALRSLLSHDKLSKYI